MVPPKRIKRLRFNLLPFKILWFYLLILNVNFYYFVLGHVNHVRNICHLELTNLLTKRTLLVFGQIQDVFNTSRNLVSRTTAKAMQVCSRFKCKKCYSLNLDSQLSIKTCRVVKARGSTATQHIGHLSRFMKFNFLGLFFIQSMIVCLGFLFSQP